MSADLAIAVPSKGRLQENAAAFFARAGLPLVKGRGSRDYRGGVAGLPAVEVAYLSAAEIARELSHGNVHAGITGEDLIRETVADADARLAFVAPLGFGAATVVVAVPQAWIDVATMSDLDDVASAFRQRHGRRFRVATKYVTLTRAFFARHGISDYRIVESLGATEGAPSAGAAEAVVDITTTGATLAANGLKVLDDGVILRSEANLVAALGADWTAGARLAMRTLLDRIAAEERARTTREVRFAAAEADRLAAEAQARFGAALPYPAAKGAGMLHVPAAAVFALVDWLRAEGAGTAAVFRPEAVFAAENPLWERLAVRLP